MEGEKESPRRQVGTIKTNWHAWWQWSASQSGYSMVPRPSRLTTWVTWQPIQWVGQASKSSTQLVTHPSTNRAQRCLTFKQSIIIIIIIIIII